MGGIKVAIAPPKSKDSRRPSTITPSGALLPTRHSFLNFSVFDPPHDIDECIAFPWVQFVVSIIGVALLVSDVPRSTLGTLDLGPHPDGTQAQNDVYKSVEPNMILLADPIADHTIRAVNKAFVKGGARSESSPLGTEWTFVNDITFAHNVSSVERAYKYDPASVGPRALVQLVNLTNSFPACMRYECACSAADVDAASVVAMTDTIVNTITAEYFPSASDASSPLLFMSKANWVDRLFQWIYWTVGYVRHERRVHAVYYFDNLETRVLHVCAGRRLRSQRVRDHKRPFFCYHHIGWRVAQKTPTSSTLKLWDDMSVRMARLRAEYPTLEFDATVFTSLALANDDRRVSYWFSLPVTYEKIETDDVIVWTRGRQCDSDGICTTVVFDDFRYRRTLVHSSQAQTRVMTHVLRGGAQLYIWVRLVLLIVGSHYARAVERKYEQARFWRRVFVTGKTFFRIPSQVMAYGSLVPVLCYAIAHYMDCALIHIRVSDMWYRGREFDEGVIWSVAPIQMRNAWIVALAVRFGMMFQTYNFHAHVSRFTEGVVGIRGLVVILTSALSVFAHYPHAYFRNVDIAEAVWIEPRTMNYNSQCKLMEAVQMEFGIRLEAKILAASCIFVVISHMVVRGAVSALLRLWGTPVEFSLLSSCSYLMPYSAGTLWSMSSMIVFWKMGRRHLAFQKRQMVVEFKNRRLSASVPVMVSSAVRVLSTFMLSSPIPLASRCVYCQRGQVQRWGKSQGCIEHEHILDVSRRPKHMWSIVRLINLAMMTDPVSLYWLYGFGCDIYVYELTKGAQYVQGERTLQYQIVLMLPVEIDMVLSGAEVFDVEYRVLAVVNSKHVPWNLLLNCG
ncbi:TPA: hypothetical protein N0F65_005730 [Lagenidium giganteum]|uniref:Uncharacterized protein n=1 Tax=Lagenidium giganteum TaxID=4803 RepID=A0AAV2ZCY2_9STRA|nr:TPA: hypothetical protein N0F65_005730 [Lagenidium giganteum]